MKFVLDIAAFGASYYLVYGLLIPALIPSFWFFFLALSFPVVSTLTLVARHPWLVGAQR